MDNHGSEHHYQSYSNFFFENFLVACMMWYINHIHGVQPTMIDVILLA